MNKELKMKSAYEIAESLFRKNIDSDGNDQGLGFSLYEIRELTGISHEVLCKLRNRGYLNYWIDRALVSLNQINLFLVTNSRVDRSYRVNAKFSAKTIKLMEEIIPALKKEKSLLPTPTDKIVNKE